MQLYLTAKQWKSYGAIHLQGRLYKGTHLCTGAQIAQALDELTTAAAISAYLQTLRGDFSLVINKPSLRCLAVSHTRLYPLFYRFENNQWHVADDPAVLQRAGDAIDSAACRQYFYTGAPFAGTTLIAGIKQCKPAYVTVLGASCCAEKAFGPYVQKGATEATGSLDADFTNVLSTVFERVVNSIGERQVVIPLSGGYDSRLVVAMLHRMGVKNMICYTVGQYHPAEQGVAHRVAKTLHVPLYHIDYRDAQYRMQQFGTQSFNQYVDAIGALGNFMWLFEYNAILWLKQQGVLQNDAIFIPGHVGDFYAGSHLQKIGIKEHESLFKLRCKLLLHAFEYGKPCFSKAFCADVKQALLRMPNQQKSSLVALQFIAENRLAHQILNSARVYEQLGYDVLLPLCDVDFVQFFTQLPYVKWSDVSFYRQYLLQNIFTPLQIAFESPQNVKKIQKQRLKNLLKIGLPKSWYLRLKKRSNLTTEDYLLDKIFDELVKKGIATSRNEFVNGNEIMLRWYLEKVKNQ